MTSMRRLGMYYADIWHYWRSNRFWCLLCLLLVAETLVYACLNAQPTDAYADYLAQTQPRYSGLFPFIFTENLKALLMTVLVGLIPFGLGTFAAAYFTMEGLASAVKVLLLRMGGRELFFCTLPHGLFEGAALILALMLSGLLSKAVTAAFLRLFRRRPVLSQLKGDVRCIGSALIFILIPLILLAAAIETWITPHIIRLIL